MAKLLCNHCNEIINTGYEPNHTELFIFDEAQTEGFSAQTTLMEILMKGKQYTYAVKCPNCGTIHIFGDENDTNKVTEVYIKKD